MKHVDISINQSDVVDDVDDSDDIDVSDNISDHDLVVHDANDVLDVTVKS